VGANVIGQPIEIFARHHWKNVRMLVELEVHEVHSPEFIETSAGNPTAERRAGQAAGAFYRRPKARLGPAQAIVATAHLLARIVYRM
jgi:hypothetical protein